MTATEAARTENPPPSDAPEAGATALADTQTPAARVNRLGADATTRSLGIACSLLALMILGFVGYLYGLSGVQEARAQTTLYARLRGELAQATAPTGPVTAGSPVAILTIPAIGLRHVVVVEGTSPENLTLGPGHLRDTPLPGQAGISVVFGRRASFGGPFGRVPSLRSGDVIEATTSQGIASYQVLRVSNSTRPVPFSELPNQLLLVTADSAVAPAHYIEAEAKLRTAVQPTPASRPQIAEDEVALGRDFYALIPAMAWAIALAAAAICGSVAAGRWSRWPAWIAAIPVVLAITWNFYQSVAALFPNLY